MWRSENSWPYKGLNSDPSVSQPIASCYTHYAMACPNQLPSTSWKHYNCSRKFISQNCKGLVIVTFCLQAGWHQGESAWELSDFEARNLLFFSAHSTGWLLVLRVHIVSDAYNYYNWTAQFMRVLSCKIWGWLEECDIWCSLFWEREVCTVLRMPEVVKPYVGH
jgi:hypothetical protein